MPRALSAISLKALLSSQTTQIFVALVTITSYEGEKFCITNNSKPVVSTTTTYNAFPFDVIFPDDIEGQISQCTLTVDNVSQEMIAAVRGAYEPFDVSLQIVRVADPDDVLAKWDYFKSVSAVYGAGAIVFRLSLARLLGEPYPEGIFSPGGFPGLF
jgi:hypothetical protein